MKRIILGGMCSMALTIIAGLFTIPLLKKIKAGQPILKYVENHKDKNGTPTMGGLFFILSSVIIFLMFGGFNTRISLVSCLIGISFMIVGFIDDFIKIKYKNNEGLKPYQKIIFQLAISMFAGIFAYKNGMTEFYVPFTKKTIHFGYFSIIFVALIFIAMTNSVNLTDGLDSLAGSVSIAYLISFILLMVMEQKVMSKIFIKQNDYENLILLSVCLIGGISGFLIFNVPKAKVFMGDTGSLAIGGFLSAISIFSSNSLFIPLIGIMFVISSISVIVQVIHYKRTKKRIFLMAPLHHHFQLKGYSESQISYSYMLITFVIGLICILCYL